MRIASWNVNGLRAVAKKGFAELVRTFEPDILGIQETKLQESQLKPELMLPGYESFFAHAEKKGYSGTAIYSRLPLKRVYSSIEPGEFDAEGRVVVAETEDLVFFNVYFPNSGMGPHRLKYKIRFYETLFRHAQTYVDQGMDVLIGGDYNVAHNEIDLKNPKRNEGNPGYMPEERALLDKLETEGWKDVFRTLYPDRVQYSWWSYRFKARERNIGWRIDYFWASPSIMPRVRDCLILDQVPGSDHCPVIIDLKD